MRLLTGDGTPRELQVQASGYLLDLIPPNAGLIIIIIGADQRPLAGAVIAVAGETPTCPS